MSLITQFLAASSKDKKQTFTSSGTFTVPEGVYTLFVTMCGGGGGRSVMGVGGYTYGGGGAGGYYINYPLAVTPGDVLTITVGAGGTSRYVYMTGSMQIAGVVTSGGASAIALGATSLLKTYGGSYGWSTNSPSTGAWIGGAGGYPNGSGGGGNNGGGGGCGLTKDSAVLGGGHNVTGSADLWGMGPMKGFGQDSAQSPIPGYGAGEFNGHTYGVYSVATSKFTSGEVKGEPGVVTLKWIGA